MAKNKNQITNPSSTKKPANKSKSSKEFEEDLLKKQTEKLLILVLFMSAIGTGAAIYETYAAGGTNTVTATLSVNHYCAFTTNVAGIYFSPAGLNPGTNTVGTVNTLAVTDTGNLNSNVLVSGSNWIYFANSFYTYNTVWASSVNAVFGQFIYTTTNAANAVNGIEIELDQTGAGRDTLITVNTLNPNSIHLGVAVPAGTATGTYTQTINIISTC